MQNQNSLLIALLRLGRGLLCIKFQTNKTFQYVSRKTCWWCGPNIAPLRVIALHQTTSQQTVICVTKCEQNVRRRFIAAESIKAKGNSNVDPKTSIKNIVQQSALAAIAICNAHQEAWQLKAEDRHLCLNKRLRTPRWGCSQPH
jgi:hypothetical protein